MHAEVTELGVYRVRPPLSAGQLLADDTLPNLMATRARATNALSTLPHVGNELWRLAVASGGSVSGRTRFAEFGGATRWAVG